MVLYHLLISAVLLKSLLSNIPNYILFLSFSGFCFVHSCIRLIPQYVNTHKKVLQINTQPLYISLAQILITCIEYWISQNRLSISDPNVDLKIAYIRLQDPLTRRQSTQFATIKSPIDAVKFSNTIQISHKCNVQRPLPHKLFPA